MKKLLTFFLCSFILGITCNTLVAHEKAVYCGGKHNGAVAAYISPDGYIIVSSTSNRAVTIVVSVPDANRKFTINVPPNAYNKPTVRAVIPRSGGQTDQYYACHIVDVICK